MSLLHKVIDFIYIKQLTRSKLYKAWNILLKVVTLGRRLDWKMQPHSRWDVEEVGTEAYGVWYVYKIEQSNNSRAQTNGTFIIV